MGEEENCPGWGAVRRGNVLGKTSYTRKNHFRMDGYYKQDIEAIERVQRRFFKRLPGQKELTYEERSKFLGWPTLELRRRVHTDLLWCYKILFEMVHLTSDHFFQTQFKSD